MANYSAKKRGQGKGQGRKAFRRVKRWLSQARVHECCFAVLALESEPVDPRL